MISIRIDHYCTYEIDPASINQLTLKQLKELIPLLLRSSDDKAIQELDAEILAVDTKGLKQKEIKKWDSIKKLWIKEICKNVSK